MARCPNCKHVFREEVIKTFRKFDKWDDYVKEHIETKVNPELNLPKSKRYKLGAKTSVQTEDRYDNHDQLVSQGRVLAEWDGDGYGYVSEGRFNHLKRMAQDNEKWGNV